MLCSRFFWSNIRNHSYIGIRFGLALFMGFVVGTVFVKLGYDQQYADQRISAIFVTLIFVMFTANAYLPDIFFLRPIYFREQGSRMYNPLAFYLGRWVADVPIVVLEIWLLTIMVYFIDNLNSGNHSSLRTACSSSPCWACAGCQCSSRGPSARWWSCPPTPTRCSPPTSTCR